MRNKGPAPPTSLDEAPAGICDLGLEVDLVNGAVLGGVQRKDQVAENTAWMNLHLRLLSPQDDCVKLQLRTRFLRGGGGCRQTSLAAATSVVAFERAFSFLSATRLSALKASHSSALGMATYERPADQFRLQLSPLSMRNYSGQSMTLKLGYNLGITCDL